MRALYFEYGCGHCGKMFLGLGLPEQSYGLFLLVTQGGETAFLNSFDDQVYDEFKALFNEQKPHFFWINDQNWVEVFHWIFKINCDPSPLGFDYWSGQLPWCPHCGSHEIKTCKEANPRQISDVLPVVTHNRWNRLSLEQKKQAVDEAIQEYYVEEYPNWLARDKEAEEFVKNLKDKPYYKDPKLADKI